MLLYTRMKKIFIKEMLIEAAADSRSTEYLPRRISAKFPGSSCVWVFSATSRSKICSCNPKLLLHIWFLEKCFNLFCEQLLANVSTLNFSLILNPFLLNALFCSTEDITNSFAFWKIEMEHWEENGQTTIQKPEFCLASFAKFTVKSLCKILFFVSCRT